MASRPRPRRTPPPRPSGIRRGVRAECDAVAARVDAATLVAESGLFDVAWYCAAGEPLPAGGAPVAHFLERGWLAGRRPNPYFDTEWYLRQNPDVGRRGINPLLHYIVSGEAEGRDPCGYFDVAWYATRHRAEPGQTLLAQFLARRWDGAASPLAEFDPVFYLARNPDVAAAGVDPFEHYMLYGYREGRNPSAEFDGAAYARAHLGGGAGENPLLHRRRTMLAERAVLAASGLFDAAFYRAEDPSGELGHDPLRHFVEQGWRAGRWPNPYFDTPWYLRQNPDVARQGINPLLHYMTAGEAEGRAPSAHFDPAWYAAEHEAAATAGALADYLSRIGQSGVGRRDVRPIAEFDPAFYRARYPDVAAAGVDPFLHYLRHGYKEGRDPSAEFDSRFYTRRYLDGETTQNPLLHWRAHRHALRLHPAPPPQDGGVFGEVRRFTRPGPEFEEVRPLAATAPRRARLLAYYLPQYHAVPENDRWWGAGFTEWTAIARGLPRFVGQYQPRTPRDLGHYTLGHTPGDTGVMRRQIEMARAAGLFGFVQYFYWFNRRRLLEGPLEAFLADGSLDFPFCLMWANENWTRRWDGAEHEVLIAQVYDPADDAALVDCLARHFRDPRYIRLGGRPLLMIYRADSIPDAPARLAVWRALFAERHGEAPIMVMAQSFGASDPRGFGFDAAVEFPPHKLCAGLACRNDGLDYLDPASSAQVFAYDDVVAASLDAPAPEFPLIRTAVPGWDNDARRQGAGLVLHGSSPAKYQAWLSALVGRAVAAPVLGEPIVCVNAWNEWAEGAYLEPDVHFGAAYLNATARAVTQDREARRLLLIGHDAFPAGSQMLLLHLLRALREAGVEAEYLLLDGGGLAPAYARAAPGHVCVAGEDVASLVAGWATRGFGAALVNSAAASWVMPLLAQAGIAASLLVHEMPGVIAARRLAEPLMAALRTARAVVIPAAAVRDAVGGVVDLPADRVTILPQGCYRATMFSAAARVSLRRSLGVGVATALVIGVGYADLRKGFDLFLQSWRAARRRGAAVLFCWVGEIDLALRLALGPEITAAEATGTFRLAGFVAEPSDWFSAADALALTSREDPFPSVVLEAMAAGLPSVAFAGGGGMPQLLADLDGGRTVAMADADAMADAVLEIAADPGLFGGRDGLAGRAAACCDFAAYVAALRAVALPETAAAPAPAATRRGPPISVAVPSYNYARYLPARLGSIFAQSLPAAEVIVLDDASDDGSAEVARATAALWRRPIRLVGATRNSGSVFAQWRRAAELAQGDLLWIAEADDAADPAFLATLAARMDATPGIDLAFTDSRVIDADGRAVSPSYQAYYRQSGAAALGEDGVFAAGDFVRRFLAERNLILNVSAVLWRRTALLAALGRCGTELERYRMAGDWRIYVELLAESAGSVAYVAAPLNHHRRHPASVTAALDTERHLGEIGLVQAAVRQRLGLQGAGQAAYRRQLAAQFRLTEAG